MLCPCCVLNLAHITLCCQNGSNAVVCRAPFVQLASTTRKPSSRLAAGTNVLNQKVGVLDVEELNSWDLSPTTMLF